MIFTAFGDMMRVPGTKGSPLEHKARGADVRIVYSPLDALKLARANPDRHVVFFAIGFETTAPSTALTLMQAKAEGIANFSVFCNHVTIIPAIRAILDSPDMRLDGFVGPGHVSTVIGCRPYEWIARDYGKPIVVSGFEPLDLLQSIVMLLRQLAAGRSEVENQYGRVVPWEGNLPALRALAEVFELRPYFEWRGLGFISQSALQIRDAYARVGRGAAVLRARRPGDRPQGGAVRRGAQGGAETPPVQAVRQGVHARAAGRRADGLVGGVLRRVLQLRASEDRGGGSEPADPGADGWPGIDRAEPRRRVRFRDPQIEMAHGAGGKASRRLVEGLFAPLFGGALRSRSATPPHLDVDGTRLAFTTDSFVVTPAALPRRLDRRARGERHGERPRGLAAPGRSPCWSRFVLEAGLAAEVLEAEVRAIAEAARRAGVADRRRRHQGGRARQGGRHVRHHHRHRPDRPAACAARRASVRPGDRVLLSGPIGDHGITILLARGELDLEADLRSDTRSVLPLVESAGRRGGAGAALDARPDPRRGGDGAQRAGPRLRPRHRTCARRASPSATPVRGACELLGLDPLHIANEGQFLAVVAPELADAALAALRATPGGEEAVDRSARSGRSRRGTVLGAATYGGTRVVDMLVGDPLPRIC